MLRRHAWVQRAARRLNALSDRAWQEEDTLLVGTHDGLTEAQRRSVELDYNMTAGRLEIPVRAALAHYIKRWLRLDLDPSQISAEQQQAVLLNRAEVDARVDELRGMP